MTERRLLVVHVVPDLRVSAGGIAGAMPAFCRALEEEGVDCRLVSFALDADSPLSDRTHVITKRTPWQLRTAIAKELARLRTEMERETPMVVYHSHGLWSFLNHAMVRAARTDQVPVVISLHGMLLPWARRHKAFRKSVAWRLYQARDLALADATHVTSDNERVIADMTGAAKQVSVIPFGVTLPTMIGRDREIVKEAETERTVLFLGRLHPIKNLASLIQAFADVRPECWRLLLVGPDEIGYRAELELLAAELGIADRVHFEGPVFGEAKDRMFAGADLLALPSHSENYGAVVAEALASGVPALASTSTPWSVLEREHFGWWVAPDRESLGSALRLITRIDKAVLQDMGRRGRAYVEHSLTWQACAKRMAALYRKIAIRKGDKLGCGE